MSPRNLNTGLDLSCELQVDFFCAILSVSGRVRPKAACRDG